MIFHSCALHLIWKGSSVSGTGADMAKGQSTGLSTRWISGEGTAVGDFSFLFLAIFIFSPIVH